MKVAFLGNQISPGGGSTSLLLMLKSLKHYEFDKYVFVSTCKSEEMKNDFSKYCNSVDIIDLDEIVSCQTSNTPFHKFILHRIRAKKKTLKFVKKLNQLNIDILHINNSVFAHSLKWIKRTSNIKIVVHIREKIDHSGIHYLQKYISKNIENYADFLITISDNESAIFSDHKNIITIANPFDFTEINSTKIHPILERELDKDTLLIGMLGRFNRLKGHIDFLKAIKLIVEKNRVGHNLKFALVGVNHPKPLWKRIVKKVLFRQDLHTEITKYITKNSIAKYILMIPYTKDVFSTINRMDIVVRPSLTGDPWGRDIIEAMAFKKPIVATGYSEYFIRNNQSGFLVPPGIPEKLAIKIWELIISKDLRKDFGKNGYNIIRAMCDLDGYGAKIIKIYDKLS